MGKLNYTNRKKEGLKLAQFIAKDLVRRTVRDPVVEIDVSGKNLGDEGLTHFTSALVNLLKDNGCEDKVVRLEELCLNDNHITAASLNSLASVIRLAHHELRDLDLSGNNIVISTKAEALDWENFLTSFSGCCVLRRIDFSGNALETKAFEIFSKVYAREEPISLVLPGDLLVDVPSPHFRDFREAEPRTQSVSSGSHADAHLDGAVEAKVPERHQGHGFKTPEKHNQLSPYMDRIYATAKGLRSVPYLVLSDTSMSDTCALHLSYILAIHHEPERLLERVPPVKAGPSAQQLALYETETRCRGIIYLPNTTLGNAGLKALDLSEIERRDSAEDAELDEDPTEFQTPIKTSANSRRTSGPRISPATMAVANRRREGRLGSEDSTGLEIGCLDTDDLDKARSRIQGDALDSAGQHSNDLWQMALRCLTLSRIMQPQTKAKEIPTPSPAPSPDATPPARTSAIGMEVWSGSPRSKVSVIRTLEVPRFGIKVSKAAIPPTPPVPKAVNQIVLSLSGHKRNRSSITWIPESSTSSPSSPVSPESVNGAHVCSTQAGEYRSNLPLGFPEDVWWRIVGFTMGADGVLSQAQQKAAFQWGVNRNTLATERECRGKREAVQIWKVLNAIGCLAYERPTQ